MAAITADDLFPFVHYEYGEAFFGSYKGMHYRVAREPLANVHYTPVDKRGEATLRVTVWPQPYNYTATDDALKTVKDFPFTQEGMDQVAPYLNEIWASRKWTSEA